MSYHSEEELEMEAELRAERPTEVSIHADAYGGPARFVLVERGVETIDLPANPRCYGCAIPLPIDAYDDDFCSFKCYCETSSVDEEDG